MPSLAERPEAHSRSSASASGGMAVQQAAGEGHAVTSIKPTLVWLSMEQIRQVVRNTSGSGGPSILSALCGLGGGEQVCRRELECCYAMRSQGAVSNSLLRGLIVLACFLPDLERGVAELAAQLELNLSTTHRYTATLHALGLIERTPSRKYRPANLACAADRQRGAFAQASCASGRSAAQSLTLVDDGSTVGLAIELQAAQVEQILRFAAGSKAPSLRGLLGSLADTTPDRLAIEERYRVQLRDAALSRGLMRGLVVLACFFSEDRDQTVSGLAGQLALNVSTVHRYLNTLALVGILERSARRGYRLALHAQQPGCAVSTAASTAEWHGLPLVIRESAEAA